MKKITHVKGDIFMLDEEFAFGREITKRRPHIIISNPNVTENTGFAIAVPITSANHVDAVHVPIKTNCEIEGSAVIIQLKSVDFAARNPEFKGRVSRETLKDIVTRAAQLIVL